MAFQLLKLLDPKLTLLLLAFLPQFVEADAPPLGQMLELSLAFMLMTFAVFIVYGVGASAAGFLALAARLAVTQR
ncbi:hypothetical protein [Billgrantia lactosivorans]|uniref:hypothetical protein n=1 Tax=Billgrantia lactosivorans TaxID=2185141 RepID=UPI0015CFB083|nr:hypothetical protein [Halomonas lactosivorans]